MYIVLSNGESAYLVCAATSHASDDALGSASDAVDDGLESRWLLVGRHVD